MSIVFDENFDAYNNGDVNGQGPWVTTGGSSWQIQDSVSQSTPKALSAPNNLNGVPACYADFSALGGNPIVKFYLRNTNNSVYAGYLAIFDSASKGWWTRMNSDQSYFLYNTDFNISAQIGIWSANTWHLVEIEIDTADKKARARIDGGAWSNWVTESNFGTQISRIKPHQGANFAGSCYWDTITIDAGVVAKSVFLMFM